MENLLSVLDLIEENCFMASIDLKDAYYSVNIDDSHRKYLRFMWYDQLFQFTCLPNGLTSAPRWFTKLLKPIFYTLRNRGFISVYYIDDTWLMGRSKEECEANVQVTSKLLTDTGFLLNIQKSQMVPVQNIEFLGFNLASTSMTITLTDEKRFKIRFFCQNLLEQNTPSIRYVAKVIGILISSLPAVQYGALYCKYLEIDKIKALKKYAGKFNAIMQISDEAKSELKWWIDHAHVCSKLIRIPNYKLLLTTDASKLGWGAIYQGKSTGGQWSIVESEKHINELELMAVLLGLQSFLSDIKNEHIRVQCDNVTAVSYINNFGGVKSLNCQKQAKNIWLWAFQRNIHLSAEHLPGSTNILADRASRIFDDNTEWTLVSHVFSKVLDKFGSFSIDLFASRLNNKLPLYASWKPDPSALFVDAFSRDWNDFKDFFAFPPFSIILQCLRKICADRAQGTLVVPLWPTQPWFPKLMKMIVSTPLILPKESLYLPFHQSIQHKQHKSLRLIACQVSGNISKALDFQMNLSQSCVNPGGHQRLNNIKDILTNGFISVVDGRLIPCCIMK